MKVPQPHAAAPAVPGAPLPARLPVVLIAGYLGAGKTTLVNHLLRHALGQRIAVLVNDFGSINIDAGLIEATAAEGRGAEHSNNVISLAGGCLCCSFGDDLVGTLAGLAARCPPPDVCLVELSGVALPAAVARSARLVQAVDVVGTLVLADAEHIQQQAACRFVGSTVLQQLDEADWLMLNKTDLVSPAALQATFNWLRQLQPQARLWAGDVAGVWPELLLDWPAEPARRRSTGLRSARPAAAVFESYACVVPENTDLAALGCRLAAPASGVLRAKALVADQLLQVAGGRWAVTALANVVARSTGGQLVMIGLVGWKPQALTSGWQGVHGG